jgi:diacylglycerol kinase family enzyme
MTSVTPTNAQVPSRSRIDRGLVLCDRASTLDASLFELRARFADHDVDPCSRPELRRRVLDARLASRPFVAIASGDPASLRLAAEALAHSETALLPLPSGSRDDFAPFFGIETIDDALKAADVRASVLVDVGRVNGRVFLHAASVGIGLGAHSHTPRVRAAARELRRGCRLVVPLDQRPVAARALVVGNGCFGPDVDDPASREHLDDNLLDFRVARADAWLQHVRRALGALTATGERRQIDRRTARAMSIEVRGASTVTVLLDGAPVHLDAPLHFESDAHALAVLAPN